MMIVGLESNYTTTFYSDVGNFCVKSFSLCSYHFLVTVVKLFSVVLVAMTASQEEGTIVG